MFACLVTACGSRAARSGQEGVLLSHCAHTRYVWNLCVEQESWWRPGGGRMPRFAERCRQLTEARAESPWLAEGSASVQQKAIGDHDQAMRIFFAGTHRRPTWRRKGRDEGFRVVGIGPGNVRQLNRSWAEVKIPKAGWMRFRWSRPVPGGVKSCRVTATARAAGMLRSQSSRLRSRFPGPAMWWASTWA